MSFIVHFISTGRVRTRTPCGSPSVPAGHGGFVRGRWRAEDRGGGDEVPRAGEMASGHGGAVQTDVARAGKILHP